MQKVYLLLRNNKQTGPYSLEEILQLNLKPFDLVWVNGRSAAWQYPFEIAALKPYVPETPQAFNAFEPIATEVLEEKKAPPQSTIIPKPDSQKRENSKRVFVSVPTTYQPVSEQKPVEQKKEEVRASVPHAHEAYVPQNSFAAEQTSDRQKPAVEKNTTTNYSRSLNDLEEEYTKWVYNKKTKKKSSVNSKDLVMATLILALIGGGYYIMSKPAITNSVLPSNKTAEQKTEQATQIIEEKKSVLNKEAMAIPDQQSAGKNITTPSNYQKPAVTKKVKNPEATSIKKPASVPITQNSIPEEKLSSNIPSQNNIVSRDGEVQQQSSKTESRQAKKKKMADVIKGWFAKKNKKEETPPSKNAVLENPKPAENRQAARRGNDVAPTKENSSEETATIVNILDEVQLSSNAPDNWMMGVKNLKITLHNRSNATIQTASVAVNYYDQNNQLLDKKMIYFSNVAPKGKATVSAPDSKWADHVEFKLTTATANENKYAAY